METHKESYFRGKIIDFPKRAVTPSEMKLLKDLPDDIAIFIVAGYTDLRESMEGWPPSLKRVLIWPLRAMVFFCGQRVDRFKMLMYGKRFPSHVKAAGLKAIAVATNGWEHYR